MSAVDWHLNSSENNQIPFTHWKYGQQPQVQYQKCRSGAIHKAQTHLFGLYLNGKEIWAMIGCIRSH